MKIETSSKYKTITSEEGMWLCNKFAKTFSKQIYMGINTEPSQWTEISEEEKLSLEAEWENEALVDEESEYTEAGKILLGVSE